MIIAKNDRIYLREALQTDTTFCIELMNTPGWLEHIGDRNIATDADALGYIQKSLRNSYKTNQFGLYIMCLTESHDPIGICGIVKRETLDLPDLGFAILPKYEGQGYVFDASILTLKFAKNKLKMNEMLAITNPNNIRCQNLLERLGFSVVLETDNDGEGEALVKYSIDLLLTPF
jgi:RimJ/RimL family protein N-acetyltransferase